MIRTNWLNIHNMLFNLYSSIQIQMHFILFAWFHDITVQKLDKLCI